MCTHDIAILPTAQAHSNFTSMHVVFLSAYYIKYGKWEYFATFSQLVVLKQVQWHSFGGCHKNMLTLT